MNKKVKTSELYADIPEYIRELFSGCEYPWEILPKIKGYINILIEKGICGYSRMGDGILVGENVKIYPNAVIEPPAIIGKNTEIRPGAFLRGAVIVGEGCVVGNSTELKNCILLDGTQVPHYNYVGDSILGEHSHLGAGSVCSNLKSDGRHVVVHGELDYDTEMRKVGAFLGDGADVGCGCVLNPGTVIGRGSSVYPKNALRGVFPEGSIIKSQTDIVERE